MDFRTISAETTKAKRSLKIEIEALNQGVVQGASLGVLPNWSLKTLQQCLLNRPDG